MTSNPFLSRGALRIAALAALFVLGARAVETTAPWPSASLYNLGQAWTNQDGASVALKSLAGEPVIAAMGYTACKDMCPAIVADMLWIDKHLPPAAVGHVRFAFFSLDPDADTPERLRLYADAHGLDLKYWTLLRADDDEVRELAAALGVGYHRASESAIDHTAVISLIDARGEIVAQQRGVQADSRALLEKLGELVAAPR